MKLLGPPAMLLDQVVGHGKLSSSSVTAMACRGSKNLVFMVKGARHGCFCRGKSTGVLHKDYTTDSILFLIHPSEIPSQILEGDKTSLAIIPNQN
jgi:hypothetical protein